MHLRVCIFLFAFFASGITSTEASFIPKGNVSLPFAEETYENLSMSDKKQIDCLAKNVYYEARGESYEGQLAVAFVTMNRIKSNDFPSNACDVVYQRVNGVTQFSWIDKKRLYKPDQKVYNNIRDLAVKVFKEDQRLKDNTNGSLYFHTAYVNPNWKTLQKVKRIGNHVFYKEARKQHNSSAKFKG